MTKVLHVVLNQVTKDTRVLKEVESLGRNGYQVTVLGVQNDAGDLPAVEAHPFFKITRIKLSTKKLPKVRLLQYLKYMEYLFRAVRFAREYSPAIIHCHDLNALPVGVLSRARQIIYDSHEFHRGRDAQGRFMNLSSGLIENLLAKRADIIITVNEEIALRLQSILGRDVSCILNADRRADLGALPGENGMTLREKLSIPKEVKIIVYAGRLFAGRGLVNLLKMVPYLKNSVVIIMGEGPFLPNLQALIEKDHLSGKAFLVPAVPYRDVSRYLSTTDLGIIPSANTSESYFLSLGNKFFHYVAAGIPVAVPERPVLRQILKKYGIGIVIDTGNPEAMAEEINRMFDNEEHYREYRARVAKAAAEFNWDNEEKKLVGLYAGLAGSKIP
jgi:glycosyltransferase involved in cell wall biosynthesis